ncbi:MAG: hypothetical protein JOZ69_06655 [Myxococcales bacterium]|nr:hypothetical protein [Myxococcales bacterium]
MSRCFGQAIAALALFGSVVACATEDTGARRIDQASGSPLTARRGAVIVDGCALDSFQSAALATPSAKKVLGEVVLLCAVPRFDGTVEPGDPSALAALAALVDGLGKEGYSARIGVSFTDETGARYDGGQTAALLADASFRARVVAALRAFLTASHASGLELDFQALPSSARADLTSFVGALSSAVRPAARLVFLAPPSVSEPSDVAGGDAVDLGAIAPLVDRVRVMTVDFSCCGSSPGPTIDSGWAVDAVRFATGRGASAVDVAFPLFGVDFGPAGQRQVSWLEATALAAEHGQSIGRGPTGAPFFSYQGSDGPHTLWFDDAVSTIDTLDAWSVLPPDVGVVYFGLGSEAPSLWDEIARRLP